MNTLSPEFPGVFGHVEFVLTGTLTSNECGWTFEGCVTAADNMWDFDPKEWGQREWYNEIITRAFGTFGMLTGGEDFSVRFAGNRQVSDSGKWE